MAAGGGGGATYGNDVVVPDAGEVVVGVVELGARVEAAKELHAEGQDGECRSEVEDRGHRLGEGCEHRAGGELEESKSGGACGRCGVVATRADASGARDKARDNARRPSGTARAHTSMSSGLVCAPGSEATCCTAAAPAKTASAVAMRHQPAARAEAGPTSARGPWRTPSRQAHPRPVGILALRLLVGVPVSECIRSCIHAHVRGWSPDVGAAAHQLVRGRSSTRRARSPPLLGRTASARGAGEAWCARRTSGAKHVPSATASSPLRTSATRTTCSRSTPPFEPTRCGRLVRPPHTWRPRRRVGPSRRNWLYAWTLGAASQPAARSPPSTRRAGSRRPHCTCAATLRRRAAIECESITRAALWRAARRLATAAHTPCACSRRRAR